MVFLLLFLSSVGALFLGIVTPLVFGNRDRPWMPSGRLLILAAGLAVSGFAVDWMIHSL